MSVTDLRGEAFKKVFAARVAADKQGHRGDVVPREYDLHAMAQAMAEDYPTVATHSAVPTVEMK